MNKKYKLLKEFPDAEKDEILTESDWEKHHCMYPKEHPDWFAPYVFTTEDGVDIYVEDGYWMLSTIIEDKFPSKHRCKNKQSGGQAGVNYFSTKEVAEKWLEDQKVPEWVICTSNLIMIAGKDRGKVALTTNMLYEVFSNRPYATVLDDMGDAHEKVNSWVREATPAEVEAHKLGFHIGDKVWNKNTRILLGKIDSFLSGDPSILVFLNPKDGFEKAFGINEITNKEPQSKLITEEGDKLYGNDKCWFVNNTTTYWVDTNLTNYVGDSTTIGKYFSKKKNAQQYWAELQAKKRGIEIGTDIFGGTEKLYNGKVTAITMNPMENDIQLHLSPTKYMYINEATTLEEFAKEEGLEIGMKLDIELVKAWAVYTNNAYIAFDNYIIYSFNLNKGVPKFSNQFRWYPIIGFKKFRKEWEAKQKFEVGKWYKHKHIRVAVYILYDGTKWGKGFQDGRWVDKWKIEFIENWELVEAGQVRELISEEVKRRYPIGTKVMCAVHTDVGPYKVKSYRWEDNSNTVSNSHECYLFAKGKWAEIVKEPKLMLGDVEVEVKYEIPKSAGEVLSKPILVVHTSKGSVNAHQWGTWFEDIKVLHKHTGEMGLKLGLYNTFSVAHGLTEIGCIKEITYSQLKAVTEAVKKL